MAPRGPGSAKKHYFMTIRVAYLCAAHVRTSYVNTITILYRWSTYHYYTFRLIERYPCTPTLWWQKLDLWGEKNQKFR